MLTERAVAPAGANLSYPAVAARAFPGAVVGGVNAAEAACLAGVVCTCFGVCAAYVDFCAGVLPPIVSRYVGGTAGAPVFAAAISPIVFLLALIDSAKTLSFTSMLGNVADSYEVQVDSKITQLTSVLEPLMIVIMGLGVAGLERLGPGVDDVEAAEHGALGGLAAGVEGRLCCCGERR